MNYLKRLGWRKINTKYCQFVSEKNRIERIIFCKFSIFTNDCFEFSIFLDECIVQMVHESNSFWYKEGSGEIKLVGKYQHEATVNILGAISRRGRSKLMIFKGNLNGEAFQQLCDQFLVPFVTRNYPEYHRIHMDNAKYHVCLDTKKNFFERDLNHFKNPAQSPDLNPIELVWHDLKTYLANEIQPNTVLELTNGIKRFWNNLVTIDYCNNKINHLFRVIPKCIRLNGKATGL